MESTGRDLAKRNGYLPATVDPEDEPSVEWGWHGEFSRGMVIAGWICTALMLLMLIGNHTGHVEDLWLIGIAAVMIGGLIRYHVKRRKAWRR